MKNISINDFVNDYKTTEENCYNFYDWFCKTESLQNRAKTMVSKLKFLIKEGIIDGDNCYVWFKNNSPVNGSLYDDMRISTLDNQDYLGGFCPKLGYKNDKSCEIWTLDKETNALSAKKFESWTTFKKFIKSNEGENYKTELINHFNSKN